MKAFKENPKMWLMVTCFDLLFFVLDCFFTIRSYKKYKKFINTLKTKGI